MPYCTKIFRRLFSKNVKSLAEIFEKEGKNWSILWEQDCTPWNSGIPAPPLEHFLDINHPTISELRIQNKNTATVFIPGCGHGYECLLFARYGFNVIGLDISNRAIAVAQEVIEKEKNIDVRSRIKLIVDDFFEHIPLSTGGYEIIFDYTFFCALEPNLRQRWADTVARIIVPQKGRLLTLMFPVPESITGLDKPSDVDPNGPPFIVWPKLYSNHLSQAGFENLFLEKSNKSIKPRFGREWFGVWRKI